MRGGCAHALPVAAGDDPVGDRRLVQEPEVAALEEPAVDVADHRDTELAELALVAQHFALTHRLAEAAEEHALSETRAEVARVHHVRKVRVRVHHHDLDAGVPIGLGEALVLAPHNIPVRVLPVGQDLAA